MEAFLYSDILKLSVVLLAIIVIVFLILKYRQNEEKQKVHIYYISGLCAFIIIELVTYICVNNDNVTDIVSYISFASTLSSLLLSVVAIIYAIVSNNKGDAQYQKIDRASDRISSSVDRFSSLSDNLSKDIDSILSKLEELKVISSETNRAISGSNGNQNSPNTTVTGKIDANKLIDDYISYGSYIGNLALLACVYSKEKNRPFSFSEILECNVSYSLGYVVASTALGIVITHIEQDKIIVDSIYPGIEKKLIANINTYIEKTPLSFREYNRDEFKKIKRLFGITEGLK